MACYPVRHAVRVATACGSADLTEGQTVDVGGLSFIVGQAATPSGPGCADALSNEDRSLQVAMTGARTDIGSGRVGRRLCLTLRDTRQARGTGPAGGEGLEGPVTRRRAAEIRKS